MPDNPPKPPRFPYVGALLCIACLGMAAWTWMRYSYARRFSRKTLAERLELCDAPPHGRGQWPSGAYVRISGEVEHLDSYRTVATGDVQLCFIRIHDPSDRSDRWIPVVNFPALLCPPDGRSLNLCGRLDVFAVSEGMPGRPTWYGQVDAGSSRFHPASVAGLVVGVMGVFVFTVAFRHWLGERARFRERAKGA